MNPQVDIKLTIVRKKIFSYFLEEIFILNNNLSNMSLEKKMTENLSNPYQVIFVTFRG